MTARYLGTVAEAIAKARRELLCNQEEPRDLLVSVRIKYRFLHEITDDKYPVVMHYFMGMNIEFTPPGAVDISIRTTRGDIKIVGNVI